MASGEVINGSDVLVFIAPSTGGTTWKAVAHATNHTLSIRMASRDTSNKGTGSFVTKAAGRLEVTGTLEGMYIDDDKYNLEDFMSMILARTPILMIFGKETTTDSGIPDTTTAGGTHFYASGEFLLTDISSSFPDEGNATYSATFEHYTGFAINSLITT
jgi:hypothetical protein